MSTLNLQSRIARRLGPALFIGVALAMGGCLSVRYLSQASYGQLEMMTSARPINEVIADPNTEPETRAMLLEVDGIKAYAREVGLHVEGNYRSYIQLDRSAAVWFVAASKPLAFEPKVWCWPIVGCFPMLSWFELEDAKAFRRQLIKDGWEVYLRGAGAYSTAGWFHDPVVSSMFRPGENAYGDLVNVLLHELMHVNVLVPDQAYFNESIAAFSGDGMAEVYLERRFGSDSAELAAYRADLAEVRTRGDRMWKAYKALDKLYASKVSDAEKRSQKKKILDGLVADIPFVRRPNNAALVGFRTYHTGYGDFARLLKACGGNWKRFLVALRTVGPSSFKEPLQDNFASVLKPLIDRRCKS